MSETIKNSIQEFLLSSSALNTNDVLVNCVINDKNAFIYSGIDEVSIEEFPKKLLRESHRSIRESGVNTLCLAKMTVALKVNEKEVHTPIFLTPVQCSINRFEKKIDLTLEEDSDFINPFLLRFFKREFNLDIPKENTLIVSALEELNLEVNEYFSVISNFHHHRFEILKELENLSECDEFSSAMKSLFGEPTEESEKYQFDNKLLLPADTDHEKVFDLVNYSNAVVQGPPGTGKSQVLTNLVSKLVSKNKKLIVVSEKHAALEVIQSKLKEFNLSNLSYIASSKNSNSDFIQSLKSVWDDFENYEEEHSVNLMLSEQYLDKLQMLLDLLNVSDLVGGVSYPEFQEEVGRNPIQKKTYSSNVPSIHFYRQNCDLFNWIFENNLNEILGQFKLTLLQTERLEIADKLLEKLEKKRGVLSQKFQLTNWEDLSVAMKKASHCQVLENELYRNNEELFIANSSKQKSFFRLYKKYKKLEIETNSFDKHQSHWEIKPSKVEAESLLSIAQKGTWFSKLKTKKRWRKLSNLPADKMIITLQRLLSEQEKIFELSKIKIKFCDLGIDLERTQLDSLKQLIDSFNNEYLNYLQEISQEERIGFTEYHQDLNELYHGIKEVFVLDEKTDLSRFLLEVKQQLPLLLQKHKDLQLLDQSSLNTLRISKTKNEFRDVLFFSHQTKLKEHFPQLSGFDQGVLVELIKDVISSKTTEANLFSKEISNGVKRRFDKYHKILITPANKLTQNEKELKQKLRKGKSLLVKEFNKKRQHKSIREIYNSDARVWLLLLKPIWLSNPSQLANCFPMEKEMFDIAIFDEASQIPLKNSLGALHRCKRVVVAGDSQQMGPSSFFKSGSDDILDLLHQANYYLENVNLEHHYRSEHPELIEFSNKQFYSGTLQAFPSSSSSNKAINRHFVDGNFIERKNITEAKAIAEVIVMELKTENKLGVVAFSEEQLNAIWHNLPSDTRIALEDKVADDQAFFKAVENVQGDECDHLLISFGYGKDENGDFHMRFGPMNTLNGRKRLNVLLTRATQKIDVFCSVKSEDFKISENESINLIRQWFNYLETNSKVKNTSFPFNLSPKQEENTLTFNRIQEALPNAKELVTLHSVLSNRGWEVKYS